jgi:glutaredoxin
MTPKKKTLPVLTLFTKQSHCPLCDKAKIILNKYKSKFIYEEVLIDTPENSKWNELYKYHIPVIHVNGKYLMKHKIDENKLIHAISNVLYD